MSTTITPGGPTSTMSGLRPAPARVRVLAAAVLGLAALLLLASLVLDLAAPAHGPGIELGPGFGTTYTAAGFLLAVCAVLVVREDPAQRFGWAVLAIAAVWTLDGFSQSYVRFAIRPGDAYTGANLALWYLDRFGAVLPLGIAALLLIFPTGRFLPGWAGRVGAVSLGGMVAGVLLAVVTPATGIEDRVRHLPAEIDLNFATLPIPHGIASTLRPFSGILTVAGVLVALATAVLRHRRSSGAERDQMRWLVWAVLVTALTLVATAVADLGSATDVVIVAIAVLPVGAMTVGVIRPSVVPVEHLLVRTLVLGAVAASLLVIDLVVVAVLTELLGSLDDRQLVTVVLLVTALGYGPLRHRLFRVVQAWILGTRGNRYDAVAGLASSLETVEDAAAQLGELARAVGDAFGVGYVAVEVDRSTGERLTASYGDRPTEVRSLPISFRGTDVGRLVLPARGLRSRLSVRDEKLLGDLVRQAVTAVRTAQLADELQVNRERLVSTREEERRRIRRDLHDGLGPAMAGVVYQLETARMLVDEQPARARDVLEKVGAHVQDIVADVRRLVHELRPPALDDRGLLGAIRQLAEVQPVDVQVHASELGQLPAAVEVAAYRIVAESLTNVVRHAGATRVRIELDRGPEELVLAIADDGRGIAPDVQAGVGLLSIRERAAELGGHTEVTCPSAGGTRVRAVLPLTAGPEDTEEDTE